MASASSLKELHQLHVVSFAAARGFAALIGVQFMVDIGGPLARQIRDATGRADAVSAVAFRACRIREFLAVPNVVAIGVQRTEFVDDCRLRHGVRTPQSDPGAYGYYRKQASGFVVDRHSLNPRLSRVCRE